MCSRRVLQGSLALHGRDTDSGPQRRAMPSRLFWRPARRSRSTVSNRFSCTIPSGTRSQVSTPAFLTSSPSHQAVRARRRAANDLPRVVGGHQERRDPTHEAGRGAVVETVGEQVDGDHRGARLRSRSLAAVRSKGETPPPRPRAGPGASRRGAWCLATSVRARPRTGRRRTRRAAPCRVRSGPPKVLRTQGSGAFGQVLGGADPVPRSLRSGGAPDAPDVLHGKPAQGLASASGPSRTCTPAVRSLNFLATWLAALAGVRVGPTPTHTGMPRHWRILARTSSPQARGRGCRPGRRSFRRWSRPQGRAFAARDRDDPLGQVAVEGVVAGEDVDAFARTSSRISWNGTAMYAAGLGLVALRPRSRRCWRGPPRACGPGRDGRPVRTRRRSCCNRPGRTSAPRDVSDGPDHHAPDLEVLPRPHCQGG